MNDGPANIVSDFMVGKTHVMIADNFCRKSEEEAEKILRSLARNLWPHISETEGQGIQNKEEAIYDAS